MLAQLGAILAAVRSVVVGTTLGVRYPILAVTAVVTVSLVGCIPTGGTLLGADPADPSARVAAVGYRSTVAPYTSHRPTTPQAWREQNERAAPSSKSGQ
jgi:hypothetical protein